jgi:polar amino acid transport system substrate-binding protein
VAGRLCLATRHGGVALQRVLAPSGTLRVAVYAGSPTSMVRSTGSGEMRGLTVELGRELGRRLQVPAQIVEYPRVAEVVAALQRGEADMTITNATTERAQRVDFAEPLVALELGLLVPAGGGAIGTVAALDRSGARIGVSQGSTSQRVLGAQLRQAALVALPTLGPPAKPHRRADRRLRDQQGHPLRTGRPGARSRVLEGRWGLEQLAIAIGKGREAALPFLREFSRAIGHDGLVDAAAARAGLRGTVPVQAR